RADSASTTEQCYSCPAHSYGTAACISFHLPRTYTFFSFKDTPTTEIYTLSLHDALPISQVHRRALRPRPAGRQEGGDLLGQYLRSEEHTSELQSRENLVCRLLLEKKNHEALTQHPADPTPSLPIRLPPLPSLRSASCRRP